MQMYTRRVRPFLPFMPSVIYLNGFLFIHNAPRVTVHTNHNTPRKIVRVEHKYRGLLNRLIHYARGSKAICANSRSRLLRR